MFAANVAAQLKDPKGTGRPENAGNGEAVSENGDAQIKDETNLEKMIASRFVCAAAEEDASCGSKKCVMTLSNDQHVIDTNDLYVRNSLIKI